jgi:hypothetical protein
VQVADLAKRIQRRKNRSAAKASTLLVVMLVPVAMIVGTVEHVLLAITVAGSFFGFRAVFGEGYLAALDDARVAISEPSPLEAALAEAHAAAEEAEEAVRAGAPLDDPRVIRARALIHRVDELTGRA